MQLPGARPTSAFGTFLLEFPLQKPLGIAVIYGNMTFYWQKTLLYSVAFGERIFRFIWSILEQIWHQSGSSSDRRLLLQKDIHDLRGHSCPPQDLGLDSSGDM